MEEGPITPLQSPKGSKDIEIEGHIPSSGLSSSESKRLTPTHAKRVSIPVLPSPTNQQIETLKNAKKRVKDMSEEEKIEHKEKKKKKQDANKIAV